MKLRYILIAALLAVSSLTFSCKTKKDPEPEIQIDPVVDFDKAAIQLMDTLSQNINGRWNLSLVEYGIKYPPATGSVVKDTTFADFAVLDITSVTRNEDPRYPKVKGEIQFRGRTYPVQFRLQSSPERLVKKTGPQAFILFEYNFPDGLIPWEKEDDFFRGSGLVGENYSIEFDARAQKMIWKGLNRDIKEITLNQL